MRVGPAEAVEILAMQDVARQGPRIVARWRAEVGEELAERTICAVSGVIGGDAEIAIGVHIGHSERIGSAATLNILPPIAVSPLLRWRRISGVVPEQWRSAW